MTRVGDALGAGRPDVEPLEVAPGNEFLEGLFKMVSLDLEALVVFSELNFLHWVLLVIFFGGRNL